jgi:hypothetical protein
VSKIQAIVSALVFTSGAGMSVCGPIASPSSAMNRRVIFRRSSLVRFLGLQMIPPFAPPNGTSNTAHFQVIHEASARTSSADTSGW